MGREVTVFDEDLEKVLQRLSSGRFFDQALVGIMDHVFRAPSELGSGPSRDRCRRRIALRINPRSSSNWPER